ncbi:MAG: ATP-binding protein [Planctomycetota bacterium]|jgi:signal transduction histidine kinase
MEIQSNTERDLEQVLGALADVLEVALVLVDSCDNPLTAWQFPQSRMQASAEPSIVSVKGCRKSEGKIVVVAAAKGKRRFVVSLPGLFNGTVFVQSEDLPEHFAWTDGKLESQVLPGCEFSMSEGADFLLGLFMHTVCEIVVKERSIAVPIDDLDVENIRRIGVSLRKKIICEKDAHQPEQFSLGGVPSLEAFLRPSALGGTTSGVSPILTSIFKDVTAGTKSSFNLMSLTGDFIIDSPWFVGLCTKVVRKHSAGQCFSSDVRCLLEATLSRRIRAGAPKCLCPKCHAGFTEIVSPVFINGLIVGAVFGGQMVVSRKSVNEILEYVGQMQPELSVDLAAVKQIPRAEFKRAKLIVSGLSALIGLLFERYCLAENWAALGKALVDLKIERQRGIFETACSAVRRLLAASEVSAFRLEGDLLILEATTAKEVGVRRTHGAALRNVPREEAVGKAYYRIGQGLTGSVVSRRQSRFERHAMAQADWVGICSEGRDPAQFFAVPIVRDERCYGVLRAVRPENFSEFPESHRTLIERFASELAIVLNNYQLSNAETREFREQAEALQTILAEAAHEFRGPLHNVLSLSAAMSYTSDSNVLVGLRQRMKEEVYRGKRITDNYLLRGVSGREELKYDLRENDLWKLAKECISRFKFRAAKKGVAIKTDHRMSRLPRLTFDYDRMDQVLSNLIDNAVKYSFDQTEVLISGKDKENTVTVTVTDMGLGIPKDAMKKIFEGYQRSAEDKRRFKPGTGLGLRIALQIVQMHGGNIYVQSDPYWDDPKRIALYEGYKTKFTITLPK